MKVALYYPWIYLTSGGERVILELVRRSRHDWMLLTSHYDRGQTFPEFANLDVRELKRVSVKRDVISTARSALTIVSQRLPEDGYDALFVLSEGLGDLITFRNRRRPTICYCLTPLRAAFDPVYRAQAEGHRGPGGRFVLRNALRLFAAADRAAWRRYARTLFVSREAAARAQRAGLLGGHRPEVLYPGIGVAAEPREQARERFFLIAGRIMWTKRIELGIEAFLKFRADHPEATDVRLVIAGIVDAKSAPYLSTLRSLADGVEQIEFQVAPTDGQLKLLYARCAAVIFTPANEDLGIVPLEAMASGKPVVAVNRGGPTETIEDGVQGFLVEPTAGAFAERMAALIAEPARAAAMGRQGIERARLFSWDRFVSRVDDILEDIVPESSAARPDAPLHERARRSFS